MTVGVDVGRGSDTLLRALMGSSGLELALAGSRAGLHVL